MASASVLVTDAGQPQPQPLPVVTIAAAADQVTEGTPARFTVSADRTPAADLAVNLAVSGRRRHVVGGTTGERDHSPPGRERRR